MTTKQKNIYFVAVKVFLEKNDKKLCDKIINSDFIKNECLKK